MFCSDIAGPLANMKSYLASLLLLGASVRAEVLWSGIFNSSFTVADFDECKYCFTFYTSN